MQCLPREKACNPINTRWPHATSAALARAAVAAVLAVFLPGCAPSGGGAGITGGGQEDIALARRIIEQGEIPDAASITVEGFLSEHSVPLDEPENPGLIYASAATAWQRDYGSFGPLATIALGFGTSLDLDEIERPPLNLCFAIDRSASMDDPLDATTLSTKMDAVRVAIDRIVGRLGPADLVSVVAFDEATSLLLDAAAGDELAEIQDAVDSIVTGGGTDLAAGMRRAYRVANGNRDDTRVDRILVFTDAELRYRESAGVREFLGVMREYADLNIGATLFGVGYTFGSDVAYDLSQVRGGNYFFISDYDRLVTLIDEDFDLFVNPIAYDVNIRLSTSLDFRVAEVHGARVEAPYGSVVNIEIPTLFFSRRAGGGVAFVRLRAGSAVDFAEANELASITVTYETPDGERVTAPVVTATLPAGLDPMGITRHFENDGAKRAVLLLNTALTLKAACADASPFGYYSYSGMANAVTRLTGLLSFFDELAEGLEDRVSEDSRALSEERALVETLRDSMEERVN